MKQKSTRPGGHPAKTAEADKLPFGRNLRELRKGSGIKQRVIAAACGVSMQSITNWETGVSEPANILTFCKLADLFKVSLDRLVGHVTVTGNVVTVNGGDYNAPVAGRDVNGPIGGRTDKSSKECAAKDKIIASQQETIARLSKMLEALAAK